MPAWTRLIVWAHLHFCPRCRRVYRSMQATGEALAALKEEPPL
jgi:predicted anti-sigma-YlaC factor YlaD